MIPVTRALIFTLIWNLQFCKSSINLAKFYFLFFILPFLFFLPFWNTHLSIKEGNSSVSPLSIRLFPSFHMTMSNIILFLFFRANESLSFSLIFFKEKCSKFHNTLFTIVCMFSMKLFQKAWPDYFLPKICIVCECSQNVDLPTFS